MIHQIPWEAGGTLTFWTVPALDPETRRQYEERKKNPRPGALALEEQEVVVAPLEIARQQLEEKKVEETEENPNPKKKKRSDPLELLLTDAAPKKVRRANEGALRALLACLTARACLQHPEAHEAGGGQAQP